MVKAVCGPSSWKLGGGGETLACRCFAKKHKFFIRGFIYCTTMEFGSYESKAAYIYIYTSIGPALGWCMKWVYLKLSVCRSTMVNCVSPRPSVCQACSFDLSIDCWWQEIIAKNSYFFSQILGDYPSILHHYHMQISGNPSWPDSHGCILFSFMYLRSVRRMNRE